MTTALQVYLVDQILTVTDKDLAPQLFHGLGSLYSNSEVVYPVEHFGGSRTKVWYGEYQRCASGQNSIVLQETVIRSGVGIGLVTRI